jgi:hypothetical protein
MSDVRMPEDLISWMQSLGWGAHHDEWHFVRRWDFWKYLAEHGDAQTQVAAKEMIAYANSQHWQRASIQEGEPGNGIEFLMMHRAMLHLILAKFPEYHHLFRGWLTPPTDPNSVDDPVQGGAPFDAAKAEGIKVLENGFADFQDDDAYGRFMETNLRPTPENPINRDPDGRLGIHNYLHNRWTDESSPINLGDPKVNILNYRFWKLHGWIDYQWWRFRRAKGFSDDDPNYKKMLSEAKHMMGGHGHPMFRATDAEETAVERPEAFGRFFQF